ncbi:4-hydroxybenzoate geranyltransferase 2 [Lolium perenne]|uniref:4-hydroxybenzoate geranyltransferase 2 n=2 Tax=Lolium TaxID=4520 RepID=UPI0021F57BF8|nr:4-hydroxybenzoate polyprenyltransferase, mitochondrial-like [Lolium perenne]
MALLSLSRHAGALPLHRQGPSSSGQLLARPHAISTSSQAMAMHRLSHHRGILPLRRQGPSPRQLLARSRTILAPSQPTEEDKKTEEDEKPTEEDKKTEEDEKESSPPPVSWVQRSLEAARPYAMLARLDKPIGSWLLAWPCMWSLTMAAMPGALPDLKMLALFGCLTIPMRGAACTVNDLFDRNIDNKVERTKSRPLASGALTPTQGLCFFGVQLLLGLGVGFLLQLNNLSRVLGLIWFPLAYSYPLMKRLTFWPQAYLGLSFNYGALLGWAAIKGTLEPTIVLPMYIAGICWTLAYDTIYAHQDIKDDLKVGVKSTAIRFGDSTKHWISAFGTATIGGLALSGYNAGLAWPYYPILAAAAAQLAWQISTVDLTDRADCNRKFVSNNWFGALVFIAIFFGRLAS